MSLNFMEGIELNLTQQFSMKIYKDQINNLTHEQAKEYLLECLRQISIKDNIIKNFINEKMNSEFSPLIKQISK
jgi:Phycobilisome degradation protein nblA